MDRTAPDNQWLVVVSGWTGAGKSTIADAIASRIDATVASFDWLMSAVRSDRAVWDVAQHPVERQRELGWGLLSRVAEQQLKIDRSCVLDTVAHERARTRWQDLADRYGAQMALVECICSDEQLHERRVEGRVRGIPGWYELDWVHVRSGRERYVPLAGPKVVIDAVDDLGANVETVLRHLDQLPREV